jgi:hypothetical protein
MMGKAAQRKRAAKAAPTGDVHERIAKEARAAQASKEPGFRHADQTPALDGLLSSAADAITARIPPSFEHEGRTYYLRASIGLVRLMVFETPTAPQPMTEGVLGSVAEFGHKPFH